MPHPQKTRLAAYCYSSFWYGNSYDDLASKDPHQVLVYLRSRHSYHNEDYHVSIPLALCALGCSLTDGLRVSSYTAVTKVTPVCSVN